jgi:uncharacterized membrane protein
MSVFVLAFLIGVFTGLRTLTPAAATSWAASFGWLNLKNTWLAFMGFAYTPYILSVLALIELVTDKLPTTPSRKVPMQFGARLAMGALCGGAIGVTGGSLVGGLVAGVIGAFVGTLGGSELRGRLTQANGGKDLSVALFEDAFAIGGAILVVSLMK